MDAYERKMLEPLDEEARSKMLNGEFPEPDYICPSCNHGLYIVDAKTHSREGVPYILCKNCFTNNPAHTLEMPPSKKR